MNTHKHWLLGSVLFNLILIPGAWADNGQLGHALDQAQAAKASYQSEDTQQASAHTRAALAHVEVLRREHKADKGLKTAQADLKDSLRQNKSQANDKASQTLNLAIERLEQFKSEQDVKRK